MGARAKALREEYDAIPPSVAEAAVALVENQEREIASLKRQRDGLVARNALLIEQKNEIELRLSTQILNIHASYLDRVSALEQQVAEIGTVADRCAQTLAGDYVLLKERVEGLAARETL